MFTRLASIGVVMSLLLFVGCEEETAPTPPPTPIKLKLGTIAANPEVLPVLNGKLVCLEDVKLVYTQKLTRTVYVGDGISSWTQTSLYDLYEIRDAEDQVLFHGICSTGGNSALDGVTKISGSLVEGSSLAFSSEHPKFSDWVIADISPTPSAESTTIENGEKSSERELEILDRLRKLESENRALQEEIKAMRSKS